MKMPASRLFLLACLLSWTAATEAREAAESTVVRQSTMTREVERVEKGKKAKKVKRVIDTVVLENRFLELVFCPALGERIVQVRDKATGRKLLYEGVIKYSGSALDEGGGSGGGIHINHPHYHAGTSYVAPLPYVVETGPDGAASLTLAYTSYPHLQRTVWKVTLRPDEAGFRSDYRFENLSPLPMGFNPWINAMFPLRKDVQFILPADWVSGHWFGIGEKEEFGNWLRPWPVDKEGVDHSFLRDMNETSVFGYGITEGYSGIYFHDDDDGLARVFDPKVMPAAKAAGKWQPEPKGWDWCEVWGGLSHNMEDPVWIGPHETIEASDYWFPVRGIGGMTRANDQLALNLSVDEKGITCGIYAPRNLGRCLIRLAVDGEPLLGESVRLEPGKPFRRRLARPAEVDEVVLTVVDESGEILLRHGRFFSKRPRRVYQMVDTPWRRKNSFTQALWEEAFTPMMAWGPWYHPPTSFAKALEKDKANPELILAYARSLMKESESDLFRGRKSPPEEQRGKALEMLLRIVEDESVGIRARRLLGILQFGGDDKKAGETFLSLKRNPATAHLSYFPLALLAAAEGDWKKCLVAAKESLLHAPDATLPRLMVALALLETGKPTEALEVLLPLMKRNPLEAAGLALAARAEKEKGRGKEADRLLALLKRIALLSPEQHEAGLQQLNSLRKGKYLDPLAVDTIRGSKELPGRAP